ncbi:MAG: right-handed parallel beta-helix repeat-containing protein [Acidobacteriaceae bacterium]|nr:right-handed parallel beta-helix repeat-containing protein [Acidobacteriaceae bacterium]
MRVWLFWALAMPGAFGEVRVAAKQGVAGIEQARNALRTAGRAATVRIGAGDYLLDHTLQFDVREPEGSVYVAEPGARLLGGVRVRGWQPVRDREILSRLPAAARAHVRMAEVAGLGAFRARGFGRDRMPAHSELFFNGQRMTVARWPNDGFARIAEASDTDPEDDGHGRKIGRLPFGFRYAEDRPSQWKPDPNIWVHGYWAWDWADTYERVTAIHAGTRSIRTAEPHGLYGFRKGQRYHFLNVLEELDQPGEYWLDLAANRIYFWPPAEVRRAEVFVSTLEGPLVRVDGARGLRLEGFTVEAGRGDGVKVQGGRGVTLRGLRIRNLGNAGVTVEGGQGHAVERCEISHTGDSAVEITGGDRATLTPGGHRVEDCDIHHMGQWVRTYNPAVKVNGVGHRVAHNAIHDAPHAGLLLTGNDHMIEYNDIHHLAMEKGDVGAIYLGRDYTERGTVIRYNYIHDLGGVGFGSMAVYLDDCASGATISGNLFYKLKLGAFVGGGRDNRVENNVFVACDPAIHVDARGMDARKVWQDMVYVNMKPKVEAMRVKEAPYRTRYPEIGSVLPYLERPGGVPPEGNVIRGNLIQGTGLAIRESARPWVKEMGDNVEVTDPAFFDPATRVYRTPPGVNFPSIPIDKIGIRKP